MYDYELLAVILSGSTEGKTLAHLNSCKLNKRMSIISGRSTHFWSSHVSRRLFRCSRAGSCTRRSRGYKARPPRMRTSRDTALRTSPGHKLRKTENLSITFNRNQDLVEGRVGGGGRAISTLETLTCAIEDQGVQNFAPVHATGVGFIQ